MLLGTRHSEAKSATRKTANFVALQKISLSHASLADKPRKSPAGARWGAMSFDAILPRLV